MEKISAVYKIVNTITNDCYVGSSNDVHRRWTQHKKPSLWNKHPNIKLYKDMKKYGVDKFRFQILCPVEPEHLKQVEQEIIDMLHPTYNDRKAKGLNVERKKKTHNRYTKKYRQTEKGKEYQKKYKQSKKGKESQRKYQQSEKCKEHQKKIPKPNLCIQR